MIVVERTAPLLTVQDRGRLGHFASGVTQSGPLDPLALAVGNALVGNAETAAALEACLGGASLRFEQDATFAITGADALASCAGVRVSPYAVHTARAGDTVEVERLARGAVWYLAVRGGIDVPLVLGSRATLLAAGLGGAAGAPIRNGATFGVDNAVHGDARHRAVPDALRTALDDRAIPLAPGPRSDALESADWDAFHRAEYAVSRASSRVGYRLEGPPLPARLPADIASEPACAGAMQLPPDGQPIVLMADHPTVGGYPMIGVVPGYARGRLAQCVPGTAVQFVPVSAADAVRARRSEREEFEAWLTARATVPRRAPQA